MGCGVEVTVVLGVNVYDAVIYHLVHVQIQTQQFLRQMSVTRVAVMRTMTWREK
jgi:hypothetical protein